MASTRRKASTQQQQQQQPTPVQQLLKAVDEGSFQLVLKLLQQPGLDINGSNRHGESSLHIAAGYGRLNVVILLQDKGANLDIVDKQGDTPLYWAARHGHSEVVRHLCEQHITINHQDKAGETAAHVASRYGHPDVLTVLCSYEANLDLQDNDGDTPLLCACWHGYQNVVECLVRFQCSLWIRNQDGDTGLHVAAVRGYYSIVKYLIESGADINIVNKDGRTTLHLATRRNHLDIVQLLCEKGCNLDTQDEDGDTALHLACREGQVSVVYTLFAAQCHLNLRNNLGSTPLHLAAANGHSEIVRCLCTGGCDMTIVDKESSTAADVAAKANHTALSSMLNTLKENGVREQCLDEIALGAMQLNRVRVLVCGASGVGKSELVSSLKSRFLQGLLRFSSSSTHNHTPCTYGFSVNQATISGAGQFSIWDFSGQSEYYPVHEFFLDSQNTIYLLVFSLLQPLEKQLAQLRFWLAMIKSKHRPKEVIQYAGYSGRRPYAILIGSFYDQPTHILSLSNGSHCAMDDTTITGAPVLSRSHSSLSLSSGPSSNRSNQVLQHLVDEFGHYFSFTDHVFLMDCRASRSREMRALRSLLGTLRDSILKDLPWVPHLAASLLQVLPSWRKELDSLPVLTWGQFLSRTQEEINPLVSDERLRIVTSALNDTGEIIHIREGRLSNLVILDPNWLGQRIFGPALSPQSSAITRLKSVTGCVTLHDVARVYPEIDSTSLMRLLQYFELCRQLKDVTTYEFPCLIKLDPLFGLWEREAHLSVYAGIQLCCSSHVHMFSPSVFPRLQLHVRAAFPDDLDDQEVTLWSDGLKCCRGEVEVCIRQTEPNRAIEVVVRGTEETRGECVALLHQFYSILLATIRESNPGTVFNTSVLSAADLRKHHRNPHLYSSMEVFSAERSNGLLSPQTGDMVTEDIAELLCCGHQGMVVSARSAPFTSIRDISLQTRVELCRLLDPPDQYGRDWCLLALQLGLQEEVPVIDTANDLSSPTDKLLTAWNREANRSVATLVDALVSIGREDAAKLIVNGVSPFCNPHSTAVVGISGAVATSYIC